MPSIFCLSLTNISVAAGNPAFSSTDGVLFNKTKTELYQFPSALGGDYVVPESVVYLRPQSFANSGVTSVVFPKILTSIDYEAFSTCAAVHLPMAQGRRSHRSLPALKRRRVTVLCWAGTATLWPF
jgi:hypothetical protein